MTEPRIVTCRECDSQFPVLWRNLNRYCPVCAALVWVPIRPAPPRADRNESAKGKAS
jgi:hypothetical protein